MDLTAEEIRLREARTGVPWRFLGPYLSERQWGTVREDYSLDGDAWSYFSHDQARSRAYRWGEFYEYFHGDNGAGLGASHQTGWTGIVARVMHLFATSTAEQFLELGKIAGIVEVAQPRSGQTASAAPSRGR